MLRTLLTLTALIVAMAVVAPGTMAFSKKSLVWDKCTSCHEPKNGKIPRVEEIRTTPEEWAIIVDRMARLYGMDLGEGEIVNLVKELCETQILSPAELDQVAYLNLLNNSQFVEVPAAGEERLFATCVRCHSVGKINSYRMNKASWAKVRDLHFYVDPPIDGQMREMRWEQEAAVVLDGLAQTLPYGKAWQAPNVDPVGSWVILGNEPGRGDFRGQASIKTGKNGYFDVRGTLTFEDGISELVTGEAILYGGHAFRTYLKHNNVDVLGAYSFTDGVLRGQHHFPAPEYRNSTSTWYPANGESQIHRVSPSYLLGDEVTTLTLDGVNLSNIKTSDLSFADGKVEVLSANLVGESIIAQVVYRGTETVQTRLQVAKLGAVDITLADMIDYISVSPELGRARVNGGIHYPAEGVQFEATAYSAGKNAIDPSDDVALGPVPAHFKLSEWETRVNDDDLVYIGGIGNTGTFIPSGDYGQVPTREFNTEATGMVKVEAEYERGGHHYAAEARLAVVPPDFIPRIK